MFANTSKGGGKKSEPPITVHTNEDSKYTIAQVAAAALMGLATDAFCRFAILPKFLLVYKARKFHLLIVNFVWR